MDADKVFSRAGYLEENYRYFHLRDTAGQELDFHFHEFDKIVLLFSGKVDYAVENTVYALRPWDILLVKHHTIHKALIDKSEPYERVIIYFDRKYFDRTMPDAALMDCFERADREGQYLLTPDDAQRAALGGVIEGFERAAQDMCFGAAALRDTLMIQFLIYLNRISPGAAQAQSGAQYDPKIEAVLSYINENLSSALSVEALAERAFLSRYHFMRLFKAQTGSTVHAYIRQKRLLYAARLIREGTPAGKAAADSGFTDYSSFHKAFRESFGMSPVQLKR